MKRYKVLVMTFITALFIILGIGSNAQEVKAAASAGTIEQATAAYHTFLSRDYIKWGSYEVYAADVEYDILDINGDKLPELILTYEQAAYADGFQRIYTFADGKMKSLGSFTDLQISKNKNFFVDCYAHCGMARIQYYRLKNGKKTELVSFESSREYPDGVKKSSVTKVKSDEDIYYYYNCKVDGKSTTYKKCMSKQSELCKNAKYIDLMRYYNDLPYCDVIYKTNKFKYDGAAFYTSCPGYKPYPNVYKEKSNGTQQILQHAASIVKHRSKYIYTVKNQEAVVVNSLFVIQANTGRISLISNKTDGMLTTTEKYVYYPVYSKYKENDVEFKIYRCKLDGQSKKARTKTIKAKYIVKCTSSYVQYQKKSAQYKYYYSSGKTKKVS